MQQITWLALGYHAPANPSRNRVYVWRKLKECGSEYFRPGVAILPDNQTSRAKFMLLAAKIREMGGDAVMAELRFLDPKDEAETIQRFKSHSEKEYREFVRESRGLSSLPPDARDELLKKLKKRYGMVRSRDFFSSGDSIIEGLSDLADDMERVAAGLGRQLRHMLDL
ncbi:MAG: hypothetical protein FWG94_09295 [Oscillospiraceae bacterium]|nr:hypothetical protein [Oscillospiraceae bacterium]